MKKHDVRIPAEGIKLAATLFESEATAAGDVVLICSAMGMARAFYRPMAEYFASQGMHAVTWDYRGVGESLNDSVRQTPASIHDWGERDLPAVIKWISQHHPGRRLVIVAHSVGGQILGMAPETRQAERIVLIASQSGYWRLWSGWQQLRIGFIWHVVIPIVSRLRGHFPSRFFGLDVDLPNGVAREWARWGRDPDYLMGRHRRPSADNYANLECPVLNIWISDDDIASFRANRRMLSWYSNTRITKWDIHPRDLDVDRIGHFRLFRETVGPKFWPRLVEWIRSDTASR